MESAIRETIVATMKSRPLEGRFTVSVRARHAAVPTSAPVLLLVTPARGAAFTGGEKAREGGRLILAEACSVVIDSSLERGHALAGHLELLARALELHLEARDALFELDGLWQVEFARG